MSWPQKGLTTSKSDNGSSLGINTGNSVTIPDGSFGNLKLRSEFMVFKRSAVLALKTLNAGAFISFLEEFAIPPDIVRAQIGVENASPTAAPQIRCSIGFSEVAGDPAQPLNTLVVGGVPSSTAGAWSQMGINGNTAPALLARAGASLNKPPITWFDPYDIPSLPRTDAGRTMRVMKVILEIGGYISGIATTTQYTAQVASAGITGWEQDTDLSAPPYGNFWRTRSQAVAGGIDPTTLTSTVADNGATNYHAAIVIRLWPKSGKCFQVVIGPGDSTLEASGDTLDKYGAVYRALHKLQNSSLPIGICNIAQAGTSPSNWRDMASIYLPEVPNSMVLTSNMSPNVGAPLGNAVRAATIVSAGVGGTPGAATLTGTTGTGTPFQIAATIGAGGSVTALGAVTVPGNYSVLPAVIASEPVTGGGLTGCTLSLSFIGPNMQLALGAVAGVKGIADQYGCGVVTVTCLPSNTAGKNWLGSDPMRIAINTASMQSNEPCIDYAATLSGSLVGNQVQFQVGTTTDQLHPNATGYAKAEAEAFTPFFKKFMG